MMSTIYDAMRFAGKPAGAIPGTRGVHYLYGHELTDTHRDNTAAGMIRRAGELVAASPGGEDDPIVLDIEYPTIRQDIRTRNHGESQADCNAAVRSSMTLLAEVVAGVQERFPRRNVYPYAGLIIFDLYAASYRVFPLTGWRGQRHAQWLNANGFLVGTPLRAACRGVFVPLFSFDETDFVYDGTDVRHATWEHGANAMIEEASGFGVPVMAQISPYTFHGQPLSPRAIDFQLRYCREQGVDVCLWQAGYGLGGMTWERAMEGPVGHLVRACAPTDVPVG